MFDFGSPVRGEPVIIETKGRDGLDGTLILRRLWRGTGVILLGGFAAVVLAVVFLGAMTPTYTAVTQILVDPADLPVIANDLSNRQPQADSGVSIAESQTRVMQSDNVLRRVIERLDLIQDDEFVPEPSTNPLVLRTKALLGMDPPPASRDPVNLALDNLRLKLGVRRAERTFVIDVYVQTKDPEKSARIANAIADAYFAEDAAARTDAARRASEALTGRLTTLRQAVEEAERKVLQYRVTNKLVTSSGRLLSDQQLSDLNQQLVTATLKTAEAKARLDQARHMRTGEAGTALPEMLQSLEMQNLRQQYATLSRNTAELAARLGDRHPAMADQYAQQRDLQRLIQREKERIIDTSQKDYDRAVAGEAAVRRSLDRAKTETAGNDRANVGLRELERELEARRSIYEAFLRRSRETNEQERLNSSNVRVISTATPPRTRTWPPSPKLVLPLALLLGLGLGAGAALWLGARRDHRVAQRLRPSVSTGARSFRAVDA
ncbi:lipopolysaccharide biosynthesis protein [Methylobacterium sp. Leaf104]|uniref:GumC family protein n=1 Tax=Methylobacterium TaxID=407 RepID=UPI0006FA1F78|nr:MULTISPECIES: GumC family protein [Methylobacterium]KQP30501.1 lipopolysaccharide biosynthesis protein [Methylobacterium sp. Leaf104]MCI9882121.1 GumC family protein [Methylobacterium goesingense]